jgi:hypothetical protein
MGTPWKLFRNEGPLPAGTEVAEVCAAAAAAVKKKRIVLRFLRNVFEFLILSCPLSEVGKAAQIAAIREKSWTRT